MPLRWRAVLYIFVGLIVLCTIVGFFSLRDYTGNWDRQGIKIVVLAPTYISGKEEQRIRFAIENKSGKAADVRLKLIVSDNDSSGFLADSGSNEFYSGEVQNEEQINRELKVLFPNSSAQGAGLRVVGTINHSAIDKIDLPISIAPIPRARSAFYYLFATWGALLLWIAKEWWDQMKQSGQATNEV